MKNFAIGCLVVFLLVAGVGGFFLYTKVIKPGMGIVQGVQQMAQMEELNKDIKNKQRFTIPSNGELNETQVADYMTAVKFMREDLQDDYDIMKAKVEELDAKEDTNNNIQGIRDIADIYQQMLTTVTEAKKSQVKAINEVGYSLEEYNWVRERVLEAAGLGVYSFGIEQLAQAAEQDSSQALQTLEDDMRAEIENANIPQVNIDLVQPYIEELPEYLGFASFGL